MSKNKVEALLFVSKEPLSPERIAKILDLEETIIYRWLSDLEKDYANRGISLRRVAGGFELVVSPDYFEDVEPLVKKEYHQLSKPTLETVVVVALNQPARKSKIAQFRGVKNPESGIHSAVELRLIKETPNGFVTTPEFLKVFGINDLAELEEKLAQQLPSHT